MMGSDGMAPATTYESAAPVVGLCLGILGSPFALVCVSYPRELNRSPCLAGAPATIWAARSTVSTIATREGGGLPIHHPSLPR